MRTSLEHGVRNPAPLTRGVLTTVGPLDRVGRKEARHNVAKPCPRNSLPTPANRVHRTATPMQQDESHPTARFRATKYEVCRSTFHPDTPQISRAHVSSTVRTSLETAVMTSSLSSVGTSWHPSTKRTPHHHPSPESWPNGPHGSSHGRPHPCRQAAPCHAS